MKSGRRTANPVEQRGLGRGHPHLAAAFEAGEQSGAAIRVEMGGNLVEQQDRRSAAPFGHQFGMGQHEAEQQCLLLAGRSARRGLGLGDSG